MRLQIKHMDSLQCRMIVGQELNNIGLQYTYMGQGLVETIGEITTDQIEILKTNILRSGLELQVDKRNLLIEKIKDLVIEMINCPEELLKINYSDYISQKLNYDYTYLSNMFSKVKGITIQHFIILNKIERVKELLLHDNLNLTEISYKLRYSSVAHLSNQFKKITGHSPSLYKQMNQKTRLYLETANT